MQVVRRRERWIPAQDHQLLYLPVVNLADQGFKRRNAGVRRFVDRLCKGDGLADVAKLLVQRETEGVNSRRLVRAGDNDRLALVGIQLFGKNTNPFGTL